MGSDATPLTSSGMQDRLALAIAAVQAASEKLNSTPEVRVDNEILEARWDTTSGGAPGVVVV